MTDLEARIGAALRPFLWTDAAAPVAVGAVIEALEETGTRTKLWWETNHHGYGGPEMFCPKPGVTEGNCDCGGDWVFPAEDDYGFTSGDRVLVLPWEEDPDE